MSLELICRISLRNYRLLSVTVEVKLEPNKSESLLASEPSPSTDLKNNKKIDFMSQNFSLFLPGSGYIGRLSNKTDVPPLMSGP